MSKTPSSLYLLLLSAFACQEARQAAPAAAPPETLESFVLRETGVDLLDSVTIRKGPVLLKGRKDELLQLQFYELTTGLGMPCLIAEDLNIHKYYLDCLYGTVPQGLPPITIEEGDSSGRRKPVVVPSPYRKPTRVVEDVLNDRYKDSLPSDEEAKRIMEIIFPEISYQLVRDDAEIMAIWEAARHTASAEGLYAAHKNTLLSFIDEGFSRILGRRAQDKKPYSLGYEFCFYSTIYFYQAVISRGYLSLDDVYEMKDKKYRYAVYIDRIPLVYR
jgi:hypothetical protein